MSKPAQTAAHTPGPWVALDPDNFDGEYYIPIETDQPVGPLLRLICEVRPCAGEITPTDTANAHLIAAAPDLLTEGEALLRELEWVNEQLDLMPDDYAAAFERFRAAIAKARATTTTVVDEVS